MSVSGIYMARRVELRNASGLSNEEIARETIERLQMLRMYKEDNCYRGVPCDDEKIREILKRGTDRTSEILDEQKERMEDEFSWPDEFDETDEYLASASSYIDTGSIEGSRQTLIRYNKPGTTYLFGEELLPEAVWHAKKTTPSQAIPAILVYLRDKIVPVDEVSHMYELIDPRKALRAVVTIDEK